MLTMYELREKLWKLRTEKFSVCNFIITDIMAHDAEQRARIAELERENANHSSIFWKAAFEMLLTHDCPPGLSVKSAKCEYNVVCEDCWKSWWEEKK